MKIQIKSTMIAPCGMNCSLCTYHQREKKSCPGCLNVDTNKINHCTKCKIKHCKNLKKFCFTCNQYPCKLIKQMDKRYKTKYYMSIIENLDNIKNQGIRKFTKNEKEKWKCKKCGDIVCVHSGKCSTCDTQIKL